MKKPTKRPSFSTEKLLIKLQRLRRYTFVAFIVLVLGSYGFVLTRITSLSNLQPSDSDINSQVQAARVPKIDDTVLNQLKSLQDNSVNVKSLFDQARKNPFDQ